MQKTNIGWTDWSANLLKYRDPEGNVVHACVRISEGCRFCYSCALAGRWGRKGKDFTAENMKPLTPFFDAKEADRILKSKAITGKKIFIDDMTDLFGNWVPDEIIDQHFAVFAERQDVTFQVLTKRADRMRKYLSNPDLEDRLTEIWQSDDPDRQTWNILLPLKNVHLGVSAEDQKQADERGGQLVETPAAIRWMSIEPMLSAISLRWAKWEPLQAGKSTNQYDGMKRLDGIVIGGESGSGHREMPLDSALMLARHAQDAGLAVHFKQDSGPRPGMQGRIPNDLWVLKQWPEGSRVNA